MTCVLCFLRGLAWGIDKTFPLINENSSIMEIIYIYIHVMIWYDMIYIIYICRIWGLLFPRNADRFSGLKEAPGRYLRLPLERKETKDKPCNSSAGPMFCALCLLGGVRDCDKTRRYNKLLKNRRRRRWPNAQKQRKNLRKTVWDQRRTCHDEISTKSLNNPTH